MKNRKDIFANKQIIFEVCEANHPKKKTNNKNTFQSGNRFVIYYSYKNKKEIKQIAKVNTR